MDRAYSAEELEGRELEQDKKPGGSYDRRIGEQVRGGSLIGRMKSQSLLLLSKHTLKHGRDDRMTGC